MHSGNDSAESLAEESQESKYDKIEEMLADEASQLGATIEDDAKEAQRQVKGKVKSQVKHEVEEDAKQDKPVTERPVKRGKTMPVDKGTKVIMAARESARTKALPAGKAMPRPLKKPAAALKRKATKPTTIARTDDDKTHDRSVHPYLGQVAMNNDKDSSRIRGKDKDNEKWLNLCSIAGSVQNRVKIANLVWRWMLSDAMARKKMTKEMIIAKKDSICKEVNKEDSEDDEDDEDNDDDDDSDDSDERC